MRLLALHLERYGAFTGRSVAFRPDARLHVVLGANEAGKSTALSAVTDLLFGIESRTRYAFLHDMPELRLGAEIAARDGSRLAFRRRKGNRNTLVDSDDAPLPDDALTPFLRGLTRSVFCRAFGLDAQGLREGGREMLDLDGEVGASLFAAGSGLRGYTALQRSLEEEAQTIFAPRKAQGRSFYQALDRYEEARRTIRATELREGAWRELNEDIAAAETRLDTVRADRERIVQERARLERLKRVAPLLAAIDAAAFRAEADADLVEASDAAIERLGAVLQALRAAEGERSRAQSALAAAQADLGAVPPESDLLAQSDAIQASVEGIKEFDKEGADLPRLRTEAARLGEELDRLAVRVGLPDGAALAERQPSDAARARTETLIREGQALAATIERVAHELSAARAEHEGLARAQAESGAPLDPAPLREALKPLDILRRRLAEREDLDSTIRKAEAVHRGQAARLSPPVADTAALGKAPLPTPATVARFRAAFDEGERARALARQRRDAALAALAALRRRMREREAGRPIASRAELDARRAERDAAFADLRDALAGAARAAPADVAAYERAVLAVDRLADDLAADAARVAEQAADAARLALDEAEAARAAEALAENETETVQALEAWAAIWRPAGIVPGSPPEMAAWLNEAETLIEAQGDLDARKLDLGVLGERIAAARAPLSELAGRAGLVEAEAVDPGLLLERVEERIAALGRRWEATREADARIRAAADGIARHEAALGQARERRAAWARDWAEALPALGLAAEARIEEAESALAAWREVPAILRERSNIERRIAGIERERTRYHDGVARLTAGLSDLDDTAPSVAIRTLHKRLQAAQKDEARREALTKGRDEAERRFAAADRILGEAHSALVRTLEEIGVGTMRERVDHRSPQSPHPEVRGEAEPRRSPPESEMVAGGLLRGCSAAPQDEGEVWTDVASEPAWPLHEIDTLHARLVTRRSLRAEFAARRDELVRVADGIGEAALRSDLAGTSADAIAADLARLAAEQEETDRQGQIAFADRDRGERRRDELAAGTGAELAAAQRKAAEAELRDEARKWAVLRLASLMLGTAVARHRAAQQDPLLTQAGALFSGLTGGAFAGLAQDYGEADEPRIVGRRASGPIVAVEGMSEGTRDQLYLALRLAYLKDYASRAEPAPFVGDDLFMSFDDARTGHGLEALASIGAQVQPILFTHHRHVADLAVARLGERADVIEL